MPSVSRQPHIPCRCTLGANLAPGVFYCRAIPPTVKRVSCSFMNWNRCPLLARRWPLLFLGCPALLPSAPTGVPTPGSAPGGWPYAAAEMLPRLLPRRLVPSGSIAHAQPQVSLDLGHRLPALPCQSHRFQFEFLGESPSRLSCLALFHAFLRFTVYYTVLFFGGSPDADKNVCSTCSSVIPD